MVFTGYKKSGVLFKSYSLTVPYGEKAASKAENIHEKIQRFREKADRQNTIQTYRGRNKGARWLPLSQK